MPARWGRGRAGPHGGWLLPAGLWALAGAVALVEVWAALSAPAGDVLPDLQVYRGAVRGWLGGDSLYAFHRPNGDTFTYPPVAACPLLAVAVLPDAVGNVAWCLVTLAVVAGLAVLVARAARRGQGPGRGPELPAAVLLLLLTGPIRSNLQFGQVSAGVALLTVADLLAVRGRWQGVLLGVATAVKLTPALFVVHLWTRGDRRAAARAALTAAGLWAAGALLAPADSLAFARDTLSGTGRFADYAVPANSSLRALLVRVGAPQPGLIWLAGSVLVAAAALVVARRLAAAGRNPAAVCVVGAGTVVVSPVSWTHHQLWLVAAAVLLAPADAVGTVAARAWTLLAVAVMAVGPAAVPVAQLTAVTENSHLVLALACLAVGAATARVSAAAAPRPPAAPGVRA